MKQIIIAASTAFGIAILVANPVISQDNSEQNGTSLMEEGARLFFEGIKREFEPAIKDLQGLAETMQPRMHSFLEEMGPSLGELLGKIEDFSVYHTPEILPNGDIIIRKKTPDEMENSEKEIDI